MTAVPAVKGNMGNIEYFQCTMSSKDLVARTPVSYTHLRAHET